MAFGGSDAKTEAAVAIPQAAQMSREKLLIPVDFEVFRMEDSGWTNPIII
jgi:hypothetical protein